jgi:hypothetical protein
MSFIYPRQIAITRPSVSVNLGASGYSGEEQQKVTTVVNSVNASIQFKRPSGMPGAGLPGDAAKTTWRVFIPFGAVPPGTIQTRDIVTDDLGESYQVISNYWNSLGWALTVEKLQN